MKNKQDTTTPLTRTPLTRAATVAGMISALSLTACQTVPMNTQTNTQTTTSPAAGPIHFKTTGKIGVLFTDPKGQKQSGSAFFAWVQADQRFAIDLTGALGIGKTYIEGTKDYAKLVSQKTGEITGDTPEDILYQATKWHAPISELPYWMMGRTTANHQHSERDDQGRLTASQEGNWQATLSYRDDDALPWKIKMLDDNNNRVIITLQTRD